MINLRGYTDKQLAEIIDFLEQRKMPTKQLMTRAEIVTVLKNNVFGLTDTGQASKWIDFLLRLDCWKLKEKKNLFLRSKKMVNHYILKYMLAVK